MVAGLRGDVMAGDGKVSVKQFREILLKGSAAEMGWQHGFQLSDRIEVVLDYYLNLWGLAESELFTLARHFREVISSFNSDYATEIDAIADGAAINRLYVYALNARSEILNASALQTEPECTSLYSANNHILAQNWDWSQLLESQVVLMRLEYPNGHRVAMLTEPGIIGKIGMNNAGVGACLNILKINAATDGLPVHIVLRSILDSTSVPAAMESLRGYTEGKASHVLFADHRGHFQSLEFEGLACHALSPINHILIHTNHYLSASAKHTEPAFPSTHERLARARELSECMGELSTFDMADILLDRTCGELSINRAYSTSSVPGFGEVGTVFSVIMNLEEKRLEIRAGSDDSGRFYPVSV